MTVSANNLIILYRESSQDSYDFATYYADSHALDYSHLVPLSCSGDELLSSYAEFQTQIENQVLEAINSEYGLDVNIIVVGYGVPGGFYDGNDIVSTTSRLSRVGHEYTKGYANPLYSRQIFKRFDDVDAQQALIVSRIDAPTLDDAKAIVLNIQAVARQGIANGKLYFDPYTVITDQDEQNYQNDMFDFENTLLPILGLTEWRTTYWDATTDVVIPKMSDDSFMWAWKADRAGYTFFLNQTTARVFHYNADLDGGASVRDPEDKRWPMLALNAGYAACAGSMSDPLPEGFLRPKPFFDALFRGATIGEAFLFAIPNLDWTVTLFGDPLVSVAFPSVTVILDGYTSASGFDVLTRNINNILGYYLVRENIFIDSFTNIVQSNDVSVKTDILPAVTSLANDVISKTVPDLNGLVSAYVAFPPLTTVQTFAQFLDTEGFQISSIVPDITPSAQVPSSLEYPFGYWDFEDVIQNPDNEFHTYYFQLQLASDINFNQLIQTGSTYLAIDEALLNADSAQDTTGWEYEKDSNVFSPITSQGIISSYAGRHVRYIPKLTAYFNTREIYYIRIRQVDEFNELTQWRVFKQVIGT